MQPLQTAFTDSYEVTCPHHENGCKALVTITRQRGGSIIDVRLRCPSPFGPDFLDSELAPVPIAKE